MFHLSSQSRRHACARTAVLAALALTALGATVAAPAQARPIGPCDGPCVTPPKPKLVTVYRATSQYSTPYFNARTVLPLRATTYFAICEAPSSAVGPYNNHWWTKFRSGTWVNNGYLKGGVKMGIGNCRAPRNDHVTPPKPLPTCVAGKYQTKYLSELIPFNPDHSILRLTWQPDLCKDGLGRYRPEDPPTIEAIGLAKLGLGLDLRAPERTSHGITYRGDIRSCITGGYVLLYFAGKGCITVGRAQITATATSRGVRVDYSAKGLRISWPKKWVWTNNRVGL